MTEDQNKEDKILRCSFCNKSQKEVNKLIAGPTVFICNECVDICLVIIEEDGNLSGVAPANKPQASSSDEVLAALSKRVIGQGKAKRRLAAAFHQHWLGIAQSTVGGPKSNILLLGPTGTGKSLSVRCLAESFDLPFAIVDATRLSGRSYFKREDAFESLLQATGGNADKASKGVVVIDHFDMLASISGENPEGRRIQESLLIPLEGAKLAVNWPQGEKSLDTSHLLFVGCGDFSSLLSRNGGREPNVPTSDPIELLARCGFLPEFAARFGTVIQFEPLSEADLAHVMDLDERQLLRHYERLFEADGIKISFTDDAIQTLAREAARRPGGVRRLTSLLENLTLTLSEDLSPDQRGTEITIDGEMVRKSLA